METELYLDIETIPSTRPGIREEIAKTITAPGQYKKPESIAEWERENKEAAVEEAWLKTSLNGAAGEIVVVSFALGEGEVITITTEDWQDPTSETKMLRTLHEAMSDCIPHAHIVGMPVVGHYVSGFDLRFITQRSIICGVRPHPILTRAAMAKPWESDKVYDTMVQWAGVGGSISLDKLCKALGVPGKGAMDGSMVWPAVRDGRIAEVSAYCPDDVRAVRNVHRRMTFRDKSLAKIAPAPAPTVRAAKPELIIDSVHTISPAPYPSSQDEFNKLQQRNNAVVALYDSPMPITLHEPEPVTPSGPPTLQLSQINEHLLPAMKTSVEGLRSLGFEPAGRDRAAMLYHLEDLPRIVDALISQLQSVRVML